MKSPRWVAVPSLVGALGVIALLVLHVLPEGTHAFLAWAMALVPLGAIAVLAREWRRRRPVTLVAGPAFLVWTVVSTDSRGAAHRDG